MAAPDFRQLRCLPHLLVLVLRRLKVTRLGGSATLIEQLTGGAHVSPGEGEGWPLARVRYLALNGAHLTEQGAGLLARCAAAGAGLSGEGGSLGAAARGGGGAAVEGRAQARLCL